MKKILIGCCTVLMAVAANAASVKWSMGNGVLTPSPDGSAMSGRASYYTMLVFNNADADAVSTALTAKSLDYATLSSTAISTYQAGKAGSHRPPPTDRRTARRSKTAIYPRSSLTR